MSCLDVMYHQTYGAHQYLPATSAAYKAAYYRRQQKQQKKLCFYRKMQDSLEVTVEGKEQKEERGRERAGGEREPAKEAPPAEAEYLSSRCVLFTYFHGDISDVVDEHFSRALSQFSAFTEDRKGSQTPLGGRWKDGPSLPAGPCTGFPSSLWSSSYPPQSSPCVPSVHPDIPPGAAFHSGEPSTWAGHSLHQPGLPASATLSESWHYALGGQGGTSYPHVHEVYPHVHAHHPHPHAHHMLHHTHNPALDPRFNPLLLTSVRPACNSAPHCEGTKTVPETGSGPAHSWPSSFHGSLDIVDPGGCRGSGERKAFCLVLR
ncbi:transcription cofactor vestigial-like protein 3 isoform X3 [Brienomyrus brachyistius]|uniref:transcription cofactor vestigial-like protein 3 isoform X3 n=1 Tax=Brienomyrus brachyistius TaxID=42636 RepID=UPI0020B22C29|nr:transcription cofactor vestigial-like protein 3 isoform X3 [Brienomyrus brachyistius]